MAHVDIDELVLIGAKKIFYLLLVASAINHSLVYKIRHAGSIGAVDAGAIGQHELNARVVGGGVLAPRPVNIVQSRQRRLNATHR